MENHFYAAASRIQHKISKNSKIYNRIDEIPNRKKSHMNVKFNASW